MQFLHRHFLDVADANGGAFCLPVAVSKMVGKNINSCIPYGKTFCVHADFYCHTFGVYDLAKQFCFDINATPSGWCIPYSRRKVAEMLCVRKDKS